MYIRLFTVNGRRSNEGEDYQVRVREVFITQKHNNDNQRGEWKGV